MSIDDARNQDDETEIMEDTTTSELIQSLSTALASSAATASDITKHTQAPPGSLEREREPADSLSMSLWLTYKPEWIKKFRSESPTGRSIMLLQALEAFNDGVDGIMISFSEP